MSRSSSTHNQRSSLFDFQIISRPKECPDSLLLELYLGRWVLIRIHKDDWDNNSFERLICCILAGGHRETSFYYHQWVPTIDYTTDPDIALNEDNEMEILLWDNGFLLDSIFVKNARMLLKKMMLLHECIQYTLIPPLDVKGGKEED